MTKKALIFQGGWAGHQPLQLAEKFKRDLEPRGFEVAIEDRLECLDDAAALRTYDLIVPGWSMGRLTGDQEKNLCDAVAAGTGLAGVHGTMGDAFRGSIHYEWMVGGRFVGHPYVGPYTVRVRQERHTLTRDLPPSFVYDSEQYYLQVDPCINVLLDTVYDLGDGSVDMPVAWTKRWGAGRVFYSSLGHVPEEFDEHPLVWAFTVDGAVWASR